MQAQYQACKHSTKHGCTAQYRKRLQLGPPRFHGTEKQTQRVLVFRAALIEPVNVSAVQQPQLVELLDPGRNAVKRLDHVGGVDAGGRHVVRNPQKRGVEERLLTAAAEQVSDHRDWPIHRVRRCQCLCRHLVVAHVLPEERRAVWRCRLVDKLGRRSVEPPGFAELSQRPAQALRRDRPHLERDWHRGDRASSSRSSGVPNAHRSSVSAWDGIVGDRDVNPDAPRDVGVQREAHALSAVRLCHECGGDEHVGCVESDAASRCAGVAVQDEGVAFAVGLRCADTGAIGDPGAGRHVRVCQLPATPVIRESRTKGR